MFALCNRRAQGQGKLAFLSLQLGVCQLEIGTCHEHLPSTSTGVKSCAAATAGFQPPLKGVQGGEQRWGILLWKSLAGKVFRQTFPGADFLSPIFVSHHI